MSVCLEQYSTYLYSFHTSGYYCIPDTRSWISEMQADFNYI